MSDEVVTVTAETLTREAVARFESQLGESLSAGLSIAVATTHAVSAVLRYGVAIGSAQAKGLVELDEKSGPQN